MRRHTVKQEKNKGASRRSHRAKIHLHASARPMGLATFPSAACRPMIVHRLASAALLVAECARRAGLALAANMACVRLTFRALRRDGIRGFYPLIHTTASIASSIAPSSPSSRSASASATRRQRLLLAVPVPALRRLLPIRPTQAEARGIPSVRAASRHMPRLRQSRRSHLYQRPQLDPHFVWLPLRFTAPEGVVWYPSQFLRFGLDADRADDSLRHVSAVMAFRAAA